MNKDELAKLLDFAERPHTQDWSLRSALCRYAQPQPERVSKVLDLVRRSEAALHPHVKRLEKERADLSLTGLLDAIQELDRLGDVLAEWAVDHTASRPDDTVDAVITDVAARLDALGVPQDDGGGRPPRRRG